MVKVFHSSVIRRPSLHSDNPTLESNRTNGVVSQEMSLDDFINNVSNNNTNNSRHAMHSTTKSSRIEEMQDLDANFDRNATSDNTATNPDWISRNNATAFRRRNPTDDTNNHEATPSSAPPPLYPSHSSQPWRVLSRGRPMKNGPITPLMGITSLEVYDEYGVEAMDPVSDSGSRTSSPSSGGGGGGVMTTASSFASRLAVIVTFATALGKFVNGLLVDISGHGDWSSCTGCVRFLRCWDCGRVVHRTVPLLVVRPLNFQFGLLALCHCRFGAHYGISDVSRGMEQGRPMDDLNGD
ncbi:hypothetical protein HJC23_005221 [Cyclotella cryptica]|uniref:Uncharacterized protein n=1 Tax=Cyclotella cryptica TaxID=29204 RepID=A0ABD3P3D1_9STRA|eukprot:CCRYP_017789-RA/>CCRYP_017789-RA protein AED:0.37 eAED:0.42 QI:0/0/0/1/1/1/2/0/295